MPQKPSLTSRFRLCSPQLGLSPQSILGGEIYDYEILKGLAKRGVKIEIILPKSRPYDTTVQNWHITKLPFTHIPAYLYNLVEIPYLFWIYRTRPFHLLRLHAPYFTGIGAWFFHLFYPHVKIIAIYHQARKGFPFDLINHLFIHHWDHIITDSQHAKKRLVKKFKVLPQKVTLIYNGYPPNLKPQPKDQATVEKLGLKGKTVLLFMGLFNQRKNPLFLLRVIEKIIAQNKQIKLILCGQGSQEDDLRKEISQKKLSPYVIIHPPVFSQVKQKLYSVADIFVHPAIHEGFPLVILEAMSMKIPIVISAAPSVSEAIDHNRTGLKARTNDVNDWANKIDLLMRNRKKRYSLAAKALLKVHKEYTWPVAVRKHLEVLRRLSG